MNNRSLQKLFLALSVLAVMWIMTSCMPSTSDGSPLATPTSDLLPPYQATVQYAQANAQATIAAGQAQTVNLNGTATALFVQGAQLAMQITQAAATDQHFGYETQTAEAQMAQQTATAEQEIAQSTSTAEAALVATQSAAGTQAALTATASVDAFNQSVRVQQTQIALTQLKNTADFQAWSWRVGLVILYVLGLGAVLVLLIVAYKNRYFLLSLLGVVRWGKDGKPYFVVAKRNKIIVALPDLSTAPALEIDLERLDAKTELAAQGSPDLQGAAIRGNAAANVFLASNTTQPQAAGPARLPRPVATPVAERLLGPAGASSPAFVIVSNPGDLPPHLRLGPDVVRLLDDQWRGANRKPDDGEVINAESKDVQP